MLVFGVGWWIPSAYVAAGSPGQVAEQFRREIEPILAQRCLQCHNATDRKGDVSLESEADLRASGLVVPGSAGDSDLLAAVLSLDGERPSMPKNAPPLADHEVAALRAWINSGAHWPPGLRLVEPAVSDYDWWSFKPLRRVRVPDDGASRTAIDSFIRRALSERRLEPSQEADRRTLIRRLSFDLTGLPPTPAEVEAFIRDPHPLAYERLIDRLLASPHHGERWARHWLDVVKYADTCGYDKDKLRPNSWPYRDYVVRAMNEDKPYHRFVQEQVAGDILFPGERDSVVALGFLAAGPWDFIGHVEVPESKIDGKVARNLDRDEMVTNTFNTFTSVTVQCARCHNHKFDPLTQEHYYNLQTLFAALDRADRPLGLSAEQEVEYRENTEGLATARERRAEVASQIRKQLGGEFEKLRARIKELRSKAEHDNSEELRELESRYTRDVSRLKPSDLLAELEAHEDQISRASSALAALKGSGLVYAAATHFAPQGNFRPTMGTPRRIRVLHRGNVQQMLGPAQPGTLPLAADTDGAFELPSSHDEAERRAALARWLTEADNPLTWRSIVNRVWQHHFGRGIVETPNDFGRMGQEPTHPALLDWLAGEFRDGGQSMKRLHREIVMSSVYRQRSDHHAENSRIDDQNRFLWRMNRRRLSAEEIRDAILAVSGRLDRRMGGAGYYLFVLEKTDHSPHYEYHKFDPRDVRSHRRSVYRFIVRSQPDPFMTSLDCADSSQSTPRRNETLTSLQALSLLNNRFNLSMSEYFAERVGESVGDDLPRQVATAIQLALVRDANASESQAMTAYAERHGLANLCRLLFNLNEFIYLD